MAALATTLQQEERPLVATARAAKLRQCCILTLGDGNLSYSLALAKQYKKRGNEPSLQLTATSYDSYDEVVAKYPEADRICAQLKEMGALVLHRVDATNIRASLMAAGAAQLKFDTIVFNHPHCGEENVRRHQSLLSHYYTSALEVLQDDEENNESGIRVTLADGQLDRWQAVERGCQAGLRLYRQSTDVDTDEVFGLAYDRKRHQNGKSFHQVTLHGERKKQTSTLLIFRRHNRNVAASLDSKQGPPIFEQAPLLPRKRKAESELPPEFACTQCERSFKSAQGLRTHVHMVHELDSGAPAKVLLSCEVCDRTFKKEDARRQHQLAKHGKDPVIKPDWYNKQQPVGIPATAATTQAVSSMDVAVAISKLKNCSICHFSFGTTEEFDAHWQALQPRIAAKQMCATCCRAFDEVRALRQHQNFCSQNLANKKSL